MKVLVAGATGQTGQRIVAELVKGNITVRALVRNLEKGQAILPADKVELVVGDVLKPKSLPEAIADCTALICATGASPTFDFTAPYRIDCLGTKNLVDAAKTMGVKHFVLVSSLCVSRFFHPLNLFWLILAWKKQGEAYLQGSGLTYTIVRPGGLKNEDNSDPVVMKGADSLFEGSIPRTKVARVCVEALLQAAAANKIVEVVARPGASSLDWEELFANVS